MCPGGGGDRWLFDVVCVWCRVVVTSMLVQIFSAIGFDVLCAQPLTEKHVCVANKQSLGWRKNSHTHVKVAARARSRGTRREVAGVRH